MKKIFFFICIFCSFFILTSCAYAGAQSQELEEHRWGRYYTDDIHHWRYCMDEGCSAVDRKTHFTQSLFCLRIPVCDTCGEKYGGPTPHVYDGNGSCIRCSEKEKGEGLEYFHAEGYYVVEGVGTCQIPDVEISPIHNALPVTEIAAHAFSNDKILKSIIIPDTITQIGWGAFSGCNALEKVKLPKDLKTIEGYLFNGCSSLSEVSIPDGVTYIGDRSFHNCHALQSIVLPDTLDHIDGMPFDDCESLQSIVYQGTKEEWEEIKKSEDSIPENISIHCIDGTLSEN